jgi:hypothetical protein
MTKEGIQKIWDGCKWVFKKVGNQGDEATNSANEIPKEGRYEFPYYKNTTPA